MRRLWLIVVFCFACGSEPAEPLPGVAAVEVGVGGSSFQSVAEGERLALTMAPQVGTGASGQHIDVAIKARGIDPNAIQIHVTLTRASDGYVASDVTRRENLESDGEAAIGYGIRAVISACFEIADKELDLRAEIADAAGKTATDTRRVRGPMFCPR